MVVVLSFDEFLVMENLPHNPKSIILFLFIDWFWAAVSNFSQTEMARLLQFTTGCSQLPHGGFQVSH